jgi:hypothetical protein
MSRFRRALAGAAMAVAMAGGGMVAAMAGAAPAHAATAPTPAVSHTFGFTVVPAAQAGGGIGPKLQCGDFCAPPPAPAPPPPTIITCTLTLMTPFHAGTSGAMVFHADTACDSNVPTIAQVQDVYYNGSPKDSDVDSEPGVPRPSAHTNNVEACAPGQWQFDVDTLIALPPGWVVLAGTNPMNALIAVSNVTCGGGSGGGGGGCATATPSVPAQPAARLPMVVTC